MSIELITKRFDEVFDLSLGRTPSRGDKSYWGGNHTWVSIADMSCGKYISSSKECITDKALVDTGIPLVRKGTVIMSFKLSIGKVCIANKDLYTNEAIMAFSLNGKYNILPDYLYYYLRAYKWNVSNEVVLGFTLNKKNISNSLITFPVSVSEQQRIVDILDKEFAKVEALKANAEQKLKNAKDLFQATLKKKLELKHGWVVKTIAEIADIKGGKRVPKGYKLLTERTAHPYIRVADFDDNGSINLDDIHFISEDVYQGIKRYIIESSDVYISIAGTIGKSGIIPDVLNGANLTENACRLILKKGLYNRFIYYCTINAPFMEQVSRLTMQAAQPKLALTRLATIKVAIPPLKEQYRVVSILDRLCDNCQSLQDNYMKTLTLCDDLKQSLLRKAFNGEL